MFFKTSAFRNKREGQLSLVSSPFSCCDETFIENCCQSAMKHTVYEILVHGIQL